MECNMNKLLLLFIVISLISGCGQQKEPTYYKPSSKGNNMSIEDRDNAIEAKKKSLIDTFDYNRPGIRLTIMVPIPHDNITLRVDEMLETRLAQIITNNGIGAIGGDPAFVLATKITPLNMSITTSAPVKTVVTCDLGLYVGNTVTGDIYGTSVQKISGVGNSAESAIVNAVQGIKNSSAIQQMLQASTERIIKYYESNEAIIRTQIGSLIQKGEYMKAYVLLASIPPEATKSYQYAQKNLPTVYNKAVLQKSSDNLIAMKNAIQKSGGQYNEEIVAYYKMIPHDSPIKAEADKVYNSYIDKIEKSKKEELDHQRQLEKERMSIERLQLEQSLETQKALVEQYKAKAESQNESGFTSLLKGCFQLAQQKLIKLIL